jgi:lysophospholipase L1-like esterase
VDGGSYTGSPFTGSNAGTGHHTFNVATGSHASVTVKGVGGGTTYLQAIELWDTATGRIECINGGSGGYSSDSLDGDGAGWGYLAGLLKTGANLAFFAFGVNDGVYAGRSKAAYKASNLNGVQRCRAAGMDVILVAPPPINDSGFDSAYRADYLAALQEISDAENVPVWDQYATFAPWSGLDSADNLHFHSPFYGQQADVYAAIINAIRA